MYSIIVASLRNHTAAHFAGILKFQTRYAPVLVSTMSHRLAERAHPS